MHIENSTGARDVRFGVAPAVTVHEASLLRHRRTARMEWLTASVAWLVSWEPAAVAAWAAVASAISSAVLTLLTWRLASLTRTLAQETRKSREAQERADIQCSVEPHDNHLNIMELVIANIGNAAAHDVKLYVEPEALRERGGERKPMRLSFATMLPGTRLRYMLNTYQDMKNKEVRGQVTYRDQFGPHDLRFKQDVEGWGGFSRVSNQPGYAMADSLKRIEQLVDGFRGFNPMRVDIVDRKAEAAEAARQTADLKKLLAEEAAKEAGRQSGEVCPKIGGARGPEWP